MHKTNHCFLIGNLGADPVERGRSAKSGPIVGFPIAENVRAFDREANDYRTVHTNWFQVTAFGALAEKILSHLHRGDRVAIQGQLRSSRYTSKSGEERSGFEIVADDVGIWQPLGQAASEPPGRVIRAGSTGASDAGRSRPSALERDDALPF